MLSVSAIEAKYKRAKLKVKNTCLWSVLNDAEKTTIQNRITLNANERCVICYRKSDDYLWIITNEQLIVLSNKRQFNYSFKSIKGVKFPGIEELKTDKKGIDHITILLSDGASITLFVENTTWHFVYELLKFFLPN